MDFRLSEAAVAKIPLYYLRGLEDDLWRPRQSRPGRFVQHDTCKRRKRWGNKTFILYNNINTRWFQSKVTLISITVAPPKSYRGVDGTA